jgi:hypothetical protein
VRTFAKLVVAAQTPSAPPKVDGMTALGDLLAHFLSVTWEKVALIASARATAAAEQLNDVNELIDAGFHTHVLNVLKLPNINASCKRILANALRGLLISCSCHSFSLFFFFFF